jgi:hypothetical protein
MSTPRPTKYDRVTRGELNIDSANCLDSAADRPEHGRSISDFDRQGCKENLASLIFPSAPMNGGKLTEPAFKILVNIANHHSRHDMSLHQ